jgi:superfamily I DNA/RNA helicase
MPDKKIPNFVITDEDINNIENLFGNIKFDEQRRNIIKNLDNINVQAFPGSGKTTVLVAKLAILASKWTDPYKGICVISHTNVAREEIEKRLGNTNIGKKLLSYPHFIGTVHSFCDTFIGLPWLHSVGNPVMLIDKDIVLEKRWRMLKRDTLTFLKCQNRNESICESIDYPIALKLKYSKTSKTYKEIETCILNSFSEGYFTFNEMLYISRYALKNKLVIPNLISNRFPFVFIDEAQDTNDIQWELLLSIFGNGLSKVQCFGDSNQAIFDISSKDNENNWQFNNAEDLTIPNSLRFGKNIAKVADTLAICVKGMVGAEAKTLNEDNKNTIFLFDKDNITDVLDAYGRLLLQTFTDEEIQQNQEGCYAVGMIHNSEVIATDDAKFPKGVSDYWHEYNPSVSMVNAKPKCYIDCFRFGLAQLIETGDINSLVEYLANAIKYQINRYSLSKITYQGTALRGILGSIEIEQQAVLRKELLELAKMPIDKEEQWNSIVNKTKEILHNLFNVDTADDNYFNWKPNSSNNGNERNIDQNVYAFTGTATQRTIKIKLASIHAVKGRTNMATLVLETYLRKHNIKSILPWLCNTPPKKKPSDTDIKRLKCHYVALTRARKLICIAMKKEDVSKEQKQQLQQMGWNIVEL